MKTPGIDLPPKGFEWWYFTSFGDFVKVLAKKHVTGRMLVQAWVTEEELENLSEVVAIKGGKLV